MFTFHVVSQVWIASQMDEFARSHGAEIESSWGDGLDVHSLIVSPVCLRDVIEDDAEISFFAEWESAEAYRAARGGYVKGGGKEMEFEE